VAPPPAFTVVKIVAVLIAGVALVLLCNADRGRIVPIRGMPWVVLLVFGVLAIWTFVLGRTRFGRYVYAIGGNAEAARRAGVNLARIRTLAFVLCSLTAGIAGVIYVARLRSISTSVDGGTLVLYAVAAAVIGGTSLFGGRGKAVHGVLGGIVIAAIYNGMGLIGVAAPAQYMVTALVLLALAFARPFMATGAAVTSTGVTVTLAADTTFRGSGDILIAPSITGTARVGQTLTLTKGTWTPSGTDPVVVTDSWQSCTDALGTQNCAARTGTTTYAIPVSNQDLGRYIVVSEEGDDVPFDRRRHTACCVRATSWWSPPACGPSSISCAKSGSRSIPRSNARPSWRP
jgi:hypothetical protein